jgi:hypothetical protein
MMKLRSPLILAAAAALLCLPASASADTTVKAKLVEVNGSGVRGTATLTATNDGGLKVVVKAEGHVPGTFHAQHVHGTGHGGQFACPTLKANDKNGDGVLTNEEGMGEYGAIFFPLTTTGSATPQDALAADRMPVADAQGRINYERTFPADMVPAGLVQHLSELHVVQHGIDYNDNGKYDLEALGPSTFAENAGKTGVPEEATNPAACGVVQGAGAADPARGGVETGGVPEAGLNVPLAAGGAALLVLAAGVVLWRRPVRAAASSAENGRPSP